MNIFHIRRSKTKKTKKFSEVFGSKDSNLKIAFEDSESNPNTKSNTKHNLVCLKTPCLILSLSLRQTWSNRKLNRLLQLNNTVTLKNWIVLWVTGHYCKLALFRPILKSRELLHANQFGLSTPPFLSANRLQF